MVGDYYILYLNGRRQGRVMSKMRFAAVLSQKSLTDGRVFRHDTILRHQSKKATKRLEKAMIGLLQVPFTVPMCFWVRMHAVWPSREKAGGSALAEERCLFQNRLML